MKVLVDSTIYTKKVANELRDIAKHKFKVKKPKIKTPKYADRRKRKGNR